tara:strand:- start:275 stop:379 length:105 start_codon:yes stop_codon:yes gene_type:complete
MEIKEKPPDDFFKGIKTSFKSVLRNSKKQPKEKV